MVKLIRRLNKKEKMVQVTSAPCSEESEPILGADQTNSNQGSPESFKVHRKSSYTEEAYKNIISSLKADPLTIADPKVALSLFDTAVKLKNVPLAKQCIEILIGLLDTDNVLLILSHISKCQRIPETDANDFQPSAPPIVEDDNQRVEDWVQDLISNLRQRCLIFIDRYGDVVLRQKEITDLNYHDILEITTRDTLQVSSEMVVYAAMMRWCMEECKRRTLKPQLINMKAVLRALVYAPRYGLMSKKDFLSRTVDGIRGPDRSGILEESETENILNYIKRRGKKSSIEELPHKLSQERKEDKSQLLGKNGDCNKFWDKCFLNFLTCFTAVFD